MWNIFETILIGFAIVMGFILVSILPYGLSRAIYDNGTGYVKNMLQGWLTLLAGGLFFYVIGLLPSLIK